MFNRSTSINARYLHCAVILNRHLSNEAFNIRTPTPLKPITYVLCATTICAYICAVYTVSKRTDKFKRRNSNWKKSVPRSKSFAFTIHRTIMVKNTRVVPFFAIPIGSMNIYLLGDKDPQERFCRHTRLATVFVLSSF